jgi:hypothetical protein
LDFQALCCNLFPLLNSSFLINVPTIIIDWSFFSYVLNDLDELLLLRKM